MGTWGAQSCKHPTFDFGSAHDLRVAKLSLSLGSVRSVEPKIVSPLPLFLTPFVCTCILSLSLKKRGEKKYHIGSL